MGSEANYYGGAQYATLASATPRQLAWFQPRVQALNPTSASASVRMPDVTGRSGGLGGPVFVVLNVHGSNSLPVRNFGGGTLLGTLPAGGAGIMLLSSASTAQGSWTLVPRTLNAAGSASRDRTDPPSSLPAVCNPARWVCVKCDDPLVAFYTNDEAVGAQVGKAIQIGTDCWRVYSVRNSGRHAISVPSFTPHDTCTACCIATGGGGGGSTVDLITSSDDGSAQDPYDNSCEQDDGNVDPEDQAFDFSFSPPIGGDL